MSILKHIKSGLKQRASNGAASSDSSEATMQLILKFAYRHLAASDSALPTFADVGLKVFSQTDEDGILLYIFSVIGTTNRRCVEMCAGDGIECNTANLIINHGWTGLLVDSKEELVRQARKFYQTHPATYVYPPRCVCSWITKDNVNTLLRENGFEGDIDLLSLDIDGVDYWIWKAIDVVCPRVVVLEYQDIIGPERSITVPYSDNFNAWSHPTTHDMPNFCGASLTAFVKLGRDKGYRLVGCNSTGYNAFFIRNDVGQKAFPEIPVGDCFKHPKVIWGMKNRWPTVKDSPWVEV